MPLDLTRIQALCFDGDGTLRDTDDIFVETVAASLSPWRAILPRLDTHRAARRFAMLAEAPGNAFLSLPDSLGLDKLATSLIGFAVHVLPPRQYHFRLVPGVQQMLAQVGQRYPLAVVSARDERSTCYFLDHYGLASPLPLS